ncbi:MAG TPA: flagellar export chaperone FliS [Gallionella sp.]|nr:flagellar export chaperone FliS [Gallionella sp.]
MNTNTAIKAYAHIGIETGVSSADSHKLILMLYQGALVAIASAKNHMLRKETAKKGKSISHAIAIIESGLQASLDKNVGGELTQNLSSLYEYMATRLISANVKNDAGILDEVTRLLSELKNAWENIRQPASNHATQPAVQPVAQPVAKTPQLIYGKK